MHFAKYLIIALFTLLACNGKTAENAETSASGAQEEIKTEDVQYNIAGKNYKSFVAYPSASKAAKPVVMVLPEWWGLTDYPKERARQLAKLGYFAMVVDFYGEGKSVETPGEAQRLAKPYYEIPIKSKMIFDAAKASLMNFPAANYDQIAVIGYCFGGAMALNMARQEADLKGAVSFHGNLMTGVKPKNNKVKYLICNGADDTFVPQEEIAAFKKQMDSANVKYTFIDYPGAVHSFTNPAATAVGEKFKMKVAYNKAADEKSWQDMQKFLQGIFK